jgi:hypothetical protein
MHPLLADNLGLALNLSQSKASMFVADYNQLMTIKQ